MLKQLKEISKGSKPAGTVVLYTSVPMDLMNEVKAEFGKRQPGVELDIFRSGADRVSYEIIQKAIKNEDKR